MESRLSSWPTVERQVIGALLADMGCQLDESFGRRPETVAGGLPRGCVGSALEVSVRPRPAVLSAGRVAARTTAPLGLLPDGQLPPVRFVQSTARRTGSKPRRRWGWHPAVRQKGSFCLIKTPCIFQNDLYTNDWCAVELVGEGLRGGKVVRLFHGKRPGGRQAIVHKSTARVVSGTAAQPVAPRGFQARV